MTITHHLDDSTIMSFAAGALPEALSAVVAAHVELCPVCAREVRRAERIGESLLAALAPRKMAAARPPCPRPDDTVDTAARPASSYRGMGGSRLPGTLARLAGSDDLDRLAWKRLAPGVWHLPLPLSEAAEGDLRLLKVLPGRAMPEHGHGGAELTLILQGAYSDKLGRFAAGDIADLGDDVEHQPVTDALEGCVCLVASERKARFKGPLARLLQPFTGL